VQEERERERERDMEGNYFNFLLQIRQNFVDSVLYNPFLLVIRILY
jgi:hypothetical protein